MAPRALINRIDRLVICASPKASCRSIGDFAWEVDQARLLRVPLRLRVIAFRNPYRRLISAYLNKYVEHSKYRQASLSLCPDARLDSFESFVAELDRGGFRCVDKVHFKPQALRYRWWRFDRVFDADDLEPLRQFVNALCGTDVAMPFRVRPDRLPSQRDGSVAAPGEPAGQPQAGAAAIPTPAVTETATAPHSAPADGSPWRWSHERLRELLAERKAPAYGCFYNADLAEQARRIYRADFRFLDQAQRSGLLDAALHSRLTRL